MVDYLNSYDDNGLFERMGGIEDSRDLPDVVAYLGFGTPFSEAFRRRFMRKGVFKRLSFPSVNGKIAGGGFVDPGSRYTLLAIDPMVIVADHSRLHGRRIPSGWADILKPEYEKSVAVVGRGTSFNETLLLSVHRLFGIEGVKRLGESIAWAGHPAEMVRQAGRGLAGAPAISVLDYFFAREIRRQDRITIVWPEEGALAIPFFALVKADVTARPGTLANFLTGQVFARICADAFFFPVSGEVAPGLDQSLSLCWPGWEYLWETDMSGLMGEILTALSGCPA